MSTVTRIKPLHTKADHAAALATIEQLWDAKPGTPDGDTLEVLATLVDVYEREHTPILPADPIEAIKFRLEQQGKTRKELESILGSRSRVAEVLGGVRRLSRVMMIRVHRELQIPFDVLMAEPAQPASVTRKRKPARARPVRA
ncbi:DNA-binding protein [soil metagenome]